MIQSSRFFFVIGFCLVLLFLIGGTNPVSAGTGNNSTVSYQNDNLSNASPNHITGIHRSTIILQNSSNSSACTNCSALGRKDKPEDAPPLLSNSEFISVLGSTSTSSPSSSTFRTDSGFDLDQYLCGSGTTISFPIDVTLNGESAESAKLVLNVYDVDSLGASGCAPEVDAVCLNGVYLGSLSGANDQWSTPSFDVPSGLIQEGSNQVTIVIDTLGTGCWCVECGWGELDINPGYPSIESITFDPTIPVTDKVTTFTAKIQEESGYEITGIEWKFYDDNGFSKNLFETIGSSKDLKETADITYKSGHFGDKSLECILYGRQSPYSAIKEFDRKSIDFKVFFPMGQTTNFWNGKSEWSTPPGSNYPNWFVFWKERGAINKMGQFDYDSSLNGGQYNGKNLFLGPQAGGSWGPYAFGPTKLANGMEYFPQTNGIETATRLIFHELTHKNIHETLSQMTPDSDKGIYTYRMGEFTSSYPFYKYTYFMSDDSLPDSYEDTNSKTNKLDTDTYNLHTIIGYFPYISYGDNEYLAYRGGDEALKPNNLQYHDDRDWSDGGKMAKAQSDKYNVIVASPSTSSEKVESNQFNNLLTYLGPTEYDGFSNFTDYGADLNNNGLFDILNIEFTYPINQTGNYTIIGNLNSTNGLSIDQSIYSNHFINGSYKLILPFNGVKIHQSSLAGPYNLTIDVKLIGSSENFDLGNLNDIYTTSPYSLSQFEGAQIGRGNSYSDKGIDSDGDGVYDKLNVNASLIVNQSGIYRVSANLYKDTNLITSTSVNSSYSTGTQTVPLMFDGTVIGLKGLNGPYQVQNVTVQDSNDTILDYNASPYTTGLYTADQFRLNSLNFTGTFSDQGIDSDSNGKYDTLRILVPAQVTKSDSYYISGSLLDSNGDTFETVTNNTTLGAGTQIIPLDFDGKSIGNHGVNGPYNLSMLEADNSNGKLVDYRSNAYTTQSYHASQFEKDGISLTGYYNSTGVDTDNNGLFNYLDLVIGVNVTDSGQYYANCALFSANGNQIDWASNSSYLSANSTTNFTFRFDGRTIYGTQTDGSLQLQDLNIYNPSISTASYSKTDVFTTDPYQYTQFEPSGIIEGIVKSQTGIPVKDVNIYVTGVSSTTSNVTGWYSLPILASGEYTITAYPNPTKYQPNTSSALVTMGKKTILDIILTPVVGSTVQINSTANDWSIIVPKGNNTYPSKSNQTFITQAKPGSTLSDVLVNNTSVGAVETWTFTNLNANQSIQTVGNPRPGQVHVFFNTSIQYGQMPLTVNFTDASLGTPTSWYWQFGDGTNNTTQNPQHTYTVPGVYSVTLRATNAQTGGIGLWNNLITVTNGPIPEPTQTSVPGTIVPQFSVTPSQGTAPLTVQFMDQSTGNPSSWIWDLGDGTISTLQNPLHQYTKSGSYPVTMLAQNEHYGGSLNKPNLIAVL